MCFEDDRRYGEISGVAEAEGDSFDAHLIGTYARASVEHDFGRTTAFSDDFDRFPRYPSDARAQRFHHRFFGGESASQLRRPVSGVSPFARSEDFVEESDRIAVAHTSDPVDLYKVDTGVYHDSGTRMTWFNRMIDAKWRLK